jgi:polar amino acid transport system substrate-binding protein
VLLPCLAARTLSAVGGLGEGARVKRSTIGLASVLAVSLVAGCGGSDSGSGGDPASDKLAQVQAKGTLVGFFEPDYAPQSLEAEGATRPADTRCDDNELTAAEVTGYDIEVTKLVARELQVEACFVSPPWTEVTSGNWGDRWDIAFGSGAITADRMERLYMTQPYYATTNRYFVAEDSTYQTPSDLDGKRIGACVSCSHEAYLKGQLVIPGAEVTLDVQDPEVVVFEVEGPGLEATARGEIDAFLAGDPVGRALIEEGAALRRLDAVPFTEYQSAFVDKSSGLSSAAFVTRVNEILQGFFDEGTLRELSREWFEEDYTSAAAEYDLDSLDQVVE